MNFSCIDGLAKHLLETYSVRDDSFKIEVEMCPQGMEGDLTVNCFRFARLFKQAPDKIAEAACEYLNQHGDVEKAEKIKAFVNVTLKADAAFKDTVADTEALLNAVVLPEDKQEKILVEFSAPNTNKPQHLGHVRNNTLGMALSSLFKRVGHNVNPVNLVNDRGIHICKSMIAYDRFSEGITPETDGKKGDHLVGDFYVRYNTELSKQLADLKAAKPELSEKSDDDLFLETEIGQATQKMLRDWESGDADVRALWKKMNDWVFAGFAETYDRMGIEFDHTYLESDTYILGKDIVEEGLAKGVFKKREDGAVFAELGKKMGQKIVLRSDGTSVYITQDLGTTVKKYEDWKTDRQIWVVGDEQILHFKQLFAILDQLGYEWAKGLYHLAYGMVNLPTGKMKSREGTVVDADDLFDELVSLAKAGTVERANGVAPEDIDERSEIIGMGALKFMLLKFNPKTTMMFDPEASVKFEGDTGPYVQYACARINSIIRKGKEEKGISVDNSAIDWSLLSTDAEKKLAIRLFFYPAQLQVAAGKMDCSVVVNYLLDLAKDFSRFYSKCPVLVADSEELVKARLALCCRVRDILTDGLNTLTIRVPEAM